MSRVRDKGTLRTFSATDTTFGADGAPKPGYPTTAYSTYSQVDVMVDNPSKLFRKRSGSGEIIITPMSKHVGEFYPLETTGSIVDSLPGGESYTWGGAWGTRGFGHNPTALLADPELVKAIEKYEALAITDAYASVGSPDLATLTELVEIKETIGFLWSPVKGMVNLTRKFRSYVKIFTAIQERHALRVAKWEALPIHIQKRRQPPPPPVYPKFRAGKLEATDIPSAWLAYRYGLMPLIYTFQDVEKAIKNRVEGAKTRATARAKQTGVVKLDHTSKPVNASWGRVLYPVVDDRVASASVTCRAGVLYEPLFSLSAQLGIQWNRVPAALYEGIPLSFVTDWFHNGSALYDALTAECRSQKILGAWVTTTVKYNCDWRQSIGPATSGGSCSGVTMTRTHGVMKTRRPASIRDVRLLLRLELNTKRVADGLALVSLFLATAKKR